MAPSSSSSPSSSSKSPTSFSLPPPPHHLSHFTPIRECEKEEQEEEQYVISTRKISTSSSIYHHPTPLHEKKNKKKPNTTLTRLEDPEKESTNWVSCNKCRPHARDKISVVPLDNNKHFPSPNTLFKSIFSSLTKRSPKSASSNPAVEEEQFKIAIAEITQKLVQATRRRDEAVLEASGLRGTMSELDKKLNKLEVYCQHLKFGLDQCRSSPDRVVEQFLVYVAEARSNVRLLSRALTMQLRHVGGRVFENLALLLQPYEVNVTPFAKNPKGMIVYLEALLNKAFFEEFESVGFYKGSASRMLNPIDRCEANYASFNSLKDLTWEEVLTKGTRHFSEEFSKFCDRKMSEIVSMFGWNKAWPEPLLQAFFGASKSVWLVHLLANSLHPGLPIFRVGKLVGFDPVYMEDMSSGLEQCLLSSDKPGTIMVRIMVAPGFYVYGNVVKCKVLCRYYNNNNISSSKDKGLTQSP